MSIQTGSLARLFKPFGSVLLLAVVFAASAAGAADDRVT